MRSCLKLARRYWSEACALALAFACTAALLGHLTWVTELFTHFRMQYVVLGAALLLVLGLRRRWATAFALLPLLVVTAWPLIPYLAPAAPPRTTPGAVELTVMSFNVEATNGRHRALRALVQAHAPDVLVLTEITRRWARALEPLFEAYPFRLIEPRRGGGDGIAVLSRVPVKDARIVPLESMPAVAVVLEAQGRELRLFGIHLRSPPGAQSVAERDRQIDALAQLVMGNSGPQIVTGDFNSTPFSPKLAAWIQATGLRDAARGRGYVYSWPAFLPIVGIPIDHSFLSPEFEVLEYSRLPDIGSDHYPILVRVALPEKGTAWKPVPPVS